MVEGCVLSNVIAVKNVSLGFLLVGSVPDCFLVEHSVTKSLLVLGIIEENVL